MTGGAAAPKQSLSAWLPIVVLGVGAGCISGLQPLLLDLLLKAGKLDVAAMGLAATAEAAGMALAVTLAALCLPLQNLRKWALLALCAMALANTGTMFGSGGAIIALRFLNGLGAGVLPEPQRFADSWRLEHRFTPAMSAETRAKKLAGWKRAVSGVLASDPKTA